MQKRLFCVVLFLLHAAIAFTVEVENPKGWTTLAGQWSEQGKWIVPSVSSDRETLQWALVRSEMFQESRWSEISFDFKLGGSTPSPQFGLLLNVRDKQDYQLLRICDAATKPLIQLLRWQYGNYRMWQEIKLPEPLNPEKTYTFSIQRAPMVDTVDWRPWKLILVDSASGRVLLRQGIENEQPAFGMGIVGLYSETVGSSFGEFTISSTTELSVSGLLQLAPLFADGMVLQQKSKIRIWGKAENGKKIRIKIAGKSYFTNSTEAGDWQLSIPPLKAQTGLEIKVISERDSVTIRDVAVGEVWLASGQSNMEMRAWQSDMKGAEKGLNDNNLRFFLQPQWPSPHPNFDGGGAWVKADSVSVPGWSAVALSFALELRRKLKVPVGIISAHWGGTAVESWMPRSVLATDSVTMPILDRVNQYQKALEKGDPVENRFPWCWDVPGQRHTPGDLFNGMIAPHIPYALKGVIWYQGESNSQRAKQYEHLFPLLISSWRDQWQTAEPEFLLCADCRI